MFKSQKEKVVYQLETRGFVSRNWALRNYITRLAAIICDLKKEGWILEARRANVGFGEGDTVYYKEQQQTLI